MRLLILLWREILNLSIPTFTNTTPVFFGKLCDKSVFFVGEFVFIQIFCETIIYNFVGGFRHNGFNGNIPQEQSEILISFKIYRLHINRLSSLFICSYNYSNYNTQNRTEITLLHHSLVAEDEKGRKHRLNLGSAFFSSPRNALVRGLAAFGCDFNSLKSESHFTPHRKFAGRRGWVNATAPRTENLRGDAGGSTPMHPALVHCGETRVGQRRCTPHWRFVGRRGWVNAAAPRTASFSGDEEVFNFSGFYPRLPYTLRIRRRFSLLLGGRVISLCRCRAKNLRGLRRKFGLRSAVVSGLFL